jgi:ketosteroid isomerase-like protein
MSEPNKALVSRFLNALCTGDIAALKPLMTDDIVAVAKGTGLVCGARNYDDIVKAAAAFPLITKTGGLSPRILTMLAEGDGVAVEWEGNATLSNGAQYHNQYAMIFTLRGGKVCGINEYFCTKLADEVLVPLLSGAVG